MSVPIDPVNASGYPFQLAVEAAIRSGTPRHGWDVAAREMPWSDGYVDIVLQRGPITAFIECKRRRDQEWIFLGATDASENITRCRVDWYNGAVIAVRPHDPAWARVFCDEFWMCEGSSESQFCVGTREKGKEPEPLEKTAATLVEAAYQLVGRPRSRVDPAEAEVAIPVIVTNARLAFLALPIAQVPVASGELEGARAMAKDVDFVRFRKTLVQRPGGFNIKVAGLSRIAADRERTVFVVSASKLDRFLEGFRAFRAGSPKGRELPEAYFDPNKYLSCILQ